MIPPLILRQATHGLSLIAVTDHNACHNAEAVIQASAAAAFTCCPVWIAVEEEVHLLCLFDTVRQCRDWQEEVLKRLPPLLNKEAAFGTQFVVDSTGEWVRTENAFWQEPPISGSKRPWRWFIHSEARHPAHVDRPSFSLLSNWDGSRFSQGSALEVTPLFVPDVGFEKWPS